MIIIKKCDACQKNQADTDRIYCPNFYSIDSSTSVMYTRLYEWFLCSMCWCKLSRKIDRDIYLNNITHCVELYYIIQRE